MHSSLPGFIVCLFVTLKPSSLSLCGQEHNECFEKNLYIHNFKALLYSLLFYCVCCLVYAWESLDIMLVHWTFSNQYCTDIQSILLLTRLLIPFLLRWSVWCNMWCHYTLYCLHDKWLVWGQYCCRIFLVAVQDFPQHNHTFSIHLHSLFPTCLLISRLHEKVAPAFIHNLGLILFNISVLLFTQTRFQASDATHTHHTYWHACSLHTHTNM